MNKQTWDKIETIVDQALTLPDDKRRAFIAKQCGEDNELFSTITELLHSIEESQGFLENPGAQQDDLLKDFAREFESISPQSSMVGQQIGNYEITKLLGHGGMGSVFLAERADGAFEHRVAVKLVRRGMDTPENIARFQRERAILANLNHPNISHMYDGGLTDDGLPYLIMEYVDGIPLDEYCARNQCDFEQRLELFKSICEAVKHAHQNLVIHRDLKPGNILVTTEGEIKILDFGIAKLLEADPTDELHFETRDGTNPLTLAYAAPEQLTGDTITTATDIYTLGVVLYKMLSGEHPFELRGKPTSKIHDLIRREDPPLPSSKALTYSNALRGDLDAIILKAMRKNPDMRYGSAGELLEEIDRYERNLPVTAHKGTVRYNLKKFYNRQKKTLLTAGFITLMIIVFGIFYTVRITQERNLANIQAEKAEEVTDFVVNLLQQNYPENSKGEEVTVRQVLDQSISQIDELEKAPEIKGKLLQVIGHAYRSIGQPDQAAPLLERSIDILETNDIENTDLARTYDVFGIITRDLGNYDEARQYLEKSVDMYQSLGETQTGEYAKALKNLSYVMRLQSDYEQASKTIEQALSVERKIYEAPDVNLAETLYILASIYRYQGDYEQAISTQLESLDMLLQLVDGPHPGVSANYNNLAILYKTQGDTAEAKKYYLKSLDMARTLHGENHPRTAVTLANISDIYLNEGKLDSAKTFIENALSIVKNGMGENHPNMVNPLDAYAKYFVLSKQYAKADSVYRKAMDILKAEYEPTHPEIANILSNRAHVAKLEGRTEEAIRLYKKSLEIKKQNFKTDHPQVQKTMRDLLPLLRQANLTQQAEAIARELNA